MTSPRRASVLAAALAGVLAATFTYTAAPAAPVSAGTRTVAASAALPPVQQVKEDLTAQLVRTLQDEPARRAFLNAIVRAGQANLLTVIADSGSAAAVEFSRLARDANDRIISLKGLDGMDGSVLRVRLADPAMARQIEAGSEPLVAASPADARREGTFPAYDLAGRQVDLDLARVPEVPVVLVELDEEAVSRVGLRVLSAELVALGVDSDLVAGDDEVRETDGDSRQPAGVARMTAAGSQYAATRLDRIWLADDEEPWWKGAAEIYGLVMGQGKNGKGRTDVIDMPYLDYDHRWYLPHQQLVNWSNFKWNAVDLLLMEEDDGTNYKAIAKTVVGAVGALFGFGAYVPLIGFVLAALPDSWFTDDDDYVDSFYMLSRELSGDLTGARPNARIRISPVTVTS